MAPSQDFETALHGISTVSGRYVIGHHPMSPGINLFACRLRSISTDQYSVVAPVIPTLGERVSASFGPFGLLDGRVLRQTHEGFTVLLQLDVESRMALARRIDNYRERPWRGVHERRSDHRHMPGDPRSVLARPDGWAQPCLIVDYSLTGAAISSAFQPAVGEVVTIGQITAEVVRLFDVGFAVRFFERQDSEQIEQLLEAPDEWREARQRLEALPLLPDDPEVQEILAADG